MKGVNHVKGKSGNRWREKLVSLLLVLAALLSFCTGCGGRTIEPPDPDDGGSNGTESSVLQWTDVQTGAEIDTLNVVLVIDVSASTLQTDPDRNWLEASCMFLNTLYASASKVSGRLPGSKNARVGVILYNDEAFQFSETLMDLASLGTVNNLKTFIRRAPITPGSGDSALTEALERAVKLLYSLTAGQEGLSERSVVLLFTDGYTPYGSDSPLPAGQSSPAQSGGYGAVPGNYGDYTASDGSAEGPPAGNYSQYASSERVAVPDFGDGHQAQLESALKRAQEYDYEIFVLMLNPNKSRDGGWEQFQAIADYTKRNFMTKLIPIFIQLGMDSRFEGMPRSTDDITWPEDYTMLSPAFLSDPMYGGGVFTNPDNTSEKVTYLMAGSPPEMMYFYAAMAANMLSGSPAAECNPRIEEYERTENNCYDIEVPASGVSALMCFFFSVDGITGINVEGPDPENPDGQIDYTLSLRDQDKYGWSNSGTMRNDWYVHTTSSGDRQFNIAALTVINPDPGTWTI